MTREQCFFLNVIGDYLFCRKSVSPEGIDWELIVKYAKSHALEGIIFHQCKRYLKEKPEYKSIIYELEYGSNRNIYQYLNNKQAFGDLKDSFCNSKIRFFAVKGLDIASLYQVPAYRTMCDLDIVMSTEDRERSYDIICSMGYTIKKLEREWKCFKNGINIELHDHLIYDTTLEPDEPREYFKKVWNYIAYEQNGYCVLDWNYHFLFLIEHTKKHFSGNGIGFRQFMDIAIVALKCEFLDWKWIENELQVIGLLDFAVTTFSFLNKWWGIESPIKKKCIDDIYEESTEFIFTNGIFGFDNDNINVNLLEKKMHLSDIPKPILPVAFALKEIFIPYNIAAELDYCGFVKGRKYLLPVAWVYRIIYVTLYKKGNISAQRKRIFGSKDIINHHRKLMNHWGI